MPAAPYQLTPEAETLYRMLTELINRALDRGMTDGDALDGVAACAANFRTMLPPHLRGGFNQRMNQFANTLGIEQQTPIVIQ